MRVASLVVLALALGLVVNLRAADEKKEVKIKGKITCAKCDLKKSDSCAVVVVADEGGKEVIYWFDEKGHEAHHKKGANVCGKGKKGTVIGTVTDKEGKKIITVKKVELDK